MAKFNLATKNRKIKLILINARITKKSFKRWRLLKHFSKKIFKKFDVCFSQNTETKARLVKLGATNTKNLGNLKFTTSKNIKYDILDNKIRSFLKEKKILITGARLILMKKILLSKVIYISKKQVKILFQSLFQGISKE